VARRDISDKQLLPFPTEQTIRIESDKQIKTIDVISKLMTELDVAWEWNNHTTSGLCSAQENVWSRSARRKRKKLEATGQNDEARSIEHDDDSTAQHSHKYHTAQLIVRVTILADCVLIEWLKGKDSVFFESFCGMIKRVVDENCKATENRVSEAADQLA
jgi:23S rRNA (adenine1618-N6)-methyltransferase